MQYVVVKEKRKKHRILTVSECYMSYGENCQYPCNKYCINQTCNRFNGSCPHICKDDNQCDIGKFSVSYLYKLYLNGRW